MPEFLSKGEFFIDFNEYSDVIDLSGFDPEYLENVATYDGKLVGLPSGIGVQALLIDKSLADEIGLEIPETLTWDDFITLGRQVQEYDSNLYFLNMDTEIMNTHVFRPYYMQLSASRLLMTKQKQ